MPDKVILNKERCCAFTGSRNMCEEDIDGEVLTTLINAVIDTGINTFLCGMARGFDLYAAEKIIEIKKVNPKIKLVACIPCPNQSKTFCAEDKEKYERVLENCDEKILISPHYYNGCMLTRNRFMVENSSKLIAYVRGSSGGTKYTMKYAVSCNMEIYAL